MTDNHSSNIPDFITTSYISPSPRIKLLSYADDLEVFLTSPLEWLVLLDLLNTYGRASNARVNLSKTVLVSLSGVAHETWVALTQEQHLVWHNSDSGSYVRYLGYPLVSHNKQLQVFLDEIKIKISYHCLLLKERNLSIWGKSLVANSLLLSRLWHVLRVVLVPKTWIIEIKSIVRKYLLSFRPAPSWNTLCLQDKFGGVNLVDIED
ncbi:hypothetical protein G6F56_002027 [Rhizopus delemar]|nr:hypothetical protein G6F56_002027 [Rhizopus delemar]